MDPSEAPSLDDPEALFAQASFAVDHVAFSRVEGEWMPVAHVGVSDKVYVVTGGRGTLLLESGAYELRRGRVLLIPAGARQQGFTDPGQPLEKHWIHFSAWTAGSLHILRFADLPTCVDGPPARRMTAVASRMQDEWADARPGRRLALRMLLLELLLTACRAPDDCRRGPDGPGLPAAPRRSMDDAHLRAVRRVLTALSTRYAEPLTIRELAEAVGWTPAHLSESFKRLVGTPPLAFLQAVRIRRAQELLTGATVPVHRVAELVGYNDANYFSRAFARHTGVSPTTYRDANGLAQPKKVQNPPQAAPSKRRAGAR